MKRTFIIMLICICLLLTACKTNPYAKDEQTAMPSEITQDTASEQAESEQNTQAEKNQTSEQQKKAEIKEETLLPDEKEPSEPAEQEPEKIPPLVPIENGVYRTSGDFDGLPKGYMSFTSRALIPSIDNFLPRFNIENYIIVRGIKKSNSTSILTVKDSALIDWYSETPFEVLDAYYGDVKSGEQIIIDEKVALLGEGKYASVGCDDCTEVIKKNVEYILFLRKSDRKTEDGKIMYCCFASSQSVYEIDEQLISDVLSNEGEFLSKDIYTIYYKDIDKLDRRIDVQKETEKLLSLSKADELTAEQQQLIERLCKQYGAK